MTYATEFGTKIIAVIIFWLVGRWLIARMLQGVLHPFKTIRESLNAAGFPAPMRAQMVLVNPVNAAAQESKGAGP